MSILYLKIGFFITKLPEGSLQTVAYVQEILENIPLNSQTQLYIYTLLIASVLWVCIWCVDISCSSYLCVLARNRGPTVCLRMDVLCLCWLLTSVFYELFYLDSSLIHHVRANQVFLLSHCNVCSTVVNEPHTEYWGKVWPLEFMFKWTFVTLLKGNPLPSSPFGISSSKQGLINSGWPHLGLYLYHLEDPMSEFSVKTSWVFKGALSS